jgi:hypothetical protein
LSKCITIFVPQLVFFKKNEFLQMCTHVIEKIITSNTMIHLTDQYFPVIFFWVLYCLSYRSVLLRLIDIGLDIEIYLMNRL